VISLTFRILIIFFIAVDAPVLPNFQHCYLPVIRIMIVYYVAASKASIYAVQTFYIPQLGIMIVLYAAAIRIISDMLIAKPEE